MSKFHEKLSQIIRVNHAGEFGAKVIYKGQIAAMKLKKDHESLKLIEHMLEQEVEHFNYFDQEIKKQKIRPTIMQPIWSVGGFALGFLTALADKKAAMTCTTAVEEVIDEHYQSQISELNKEKQFLNDEAKKQINELQNKIDQFREEEIQHRDIGYENHAADLKIFKPLSLLIKGTTKFAIAVSKRI